MQFLEKITEKLAEALKTSHEAVVVDAVDGRVIKALGLRTQLLSASAVNPADPFYNSWAQAVATLVGKHLCGPYISGAKLYKDPIPLCSFPDIDTSGCEYGCAPIMVLGMGTTEAYLPPCHGKESPACSPYVNETTRCVMVKSVGCPTTGSQAYNVAYSMLDLSNSSYTVNYVELYYNDKRLLRVDLSTPFQKTSDQIAYIYLQVDFPFDTYG
jgi:hypothetical protein